MSKSVAKQAKTEGESAATEAAEHKAAAKNYRQDRQETGPVDQEARLRPNGPRGAMVPQTPYLAPRGTSLMGDLLWT